MNRLRSRLTALDLRCCSVAVGSVTRACATSPAPWRPEVHMEEAGRRDRKPLVQQHLGLADHPDVGGGRNRRTQTVWPGTASLCAFICARFDIDRGELERRVHGGPSASRRRCRYVSCWTANEGVIPTIATAGHTIISDELNHASIIDGCRLAGREAARGTSTATWPISKRSLREAEGTPFIITDGVFSMEGSLAKLPQIVELPQKYAP